MDKRLKPVISQHRDDENCSEVYTLVVPDAWLIFTRWPRLKLRWWMCKLLWEACGRR